MSSYIFVIYFPLADVKLLCLILQKKQNELILQNEQNELVIVNNFFLGVFEGKENILYNAHQHTAVP